MKKVAGALQANLGTVANIPKPTVAAITGYAPRRRARGGAERRPADRRRQRQARAAGDPARRYSRRQRHPAGWPSSSASQGQDLIFTGRFVDAEEALAIGLVDEVVAPDDVYSAALKWAGQFTRSSVAIAAARKRQSIRASETDLATGLKIEEQQFTALFTTEDRTIGMASFENGPSESRIRRPLETCSTPSKLRRCRPNPIDPDPESAATEAGAGGIKDTKLAQVLYHDWRPGNLRRKWSISFDERVHRLRAWTFRRGVTDSAAVQPGGGDWVVARGSSCST